MRERQPGKSRLQKTVDPHARFVSRLFGHLSEKQGHLPHQWFADEIARLDTVAGDVETIAGRIAAARSWAYIAHRADWLADPAHWAERTRELEERLSDALHAGLTQRFVDKRTTALIRQIGADVSVGHGAVVHGCTVEDEVLIGMNATVLNGAVIGTGSLVAAGAVVLEGTVVPPRSLVTGVPGRVRRELTDEEQEKVRANARTYVRLSAEHRRLTA